MLFTEAPFLDRFALARKSGFRFVEYLFPYPYKVDELKEQLKLHGLTQVMFNLPSGDWAAGERGIAGLPGRSEEFRAGVKRALEYATALGVTRLNCLAGKRLPQFAEENQWRVLVENVQFAAKALQPYGFTLLVEALNAFDCPGFLLTRTAQVVKLIEEAGMPNVMVQYDVYHAQRQEGEIVATLRKHAPQIGHIQIADNPGRHQPGTGELNFPFIFNEIDASGFHGYIGLEYVPLQDTKSSLGWLDEFGYPLPLSNVTNPRKVHSPG